MMSGTHVENVESEISAMNPNSVNSIGPDDIENCPECGATIDRRRVGCQALMDALHIQALSDPKLGRVYRLAFDTYCMQHVETYCRSAKSYAAHLTALCCGLEHGGDAAIYAAIQRWLNGNVPLEKPAILSERGSITVADIHIIEDVDEQIKRIPEWARSVWDAYQSQHEIARNWIQVARFRKVSR